MRLITLMSLVDLTEVIASVMRVYADEATDAQTKLDCLAGVKVYCQELLLRLEEEGDK